MAIKKLVLIRHGESTWNKENRFTGWTDVALSEKGVEEAHQAGKLLKAEGYTFDYAYTSVLKRAIATLWYIQEEMGLEWIPVEKEWRLNERHYGALQGLNKAETATPEKSAVATYRELQALQDDLSTSLRDVFTKHRKLVSH